MTQLKNLIKKYFTSFTFFYRQIGKSVFGMVALSLAVSLLDGFGLTMFLPLLQVVSGEGQVDPAALGKLRFLVEGAESMGISMTLVTVLLFMIVFFIFKGIASYGKSLYSVIVQQRFIKNIRLRLLRSLNTMSFKHFIASDAGQIQNTMSGEVDKVSQAFVSYFGTLQQAVMVLIYIAFAFFIDAQFAILVALGGIVTNVLYKLIYSKTKEASRKLTGAGNTYQGLIIQHVANFKYLKATSMMDKHAEKMTSKIQEMENTRKKIGMLSSIGGSVREPLLIIIVSVVILIQVKVLEGSMGSLLVSLLFFYRALSSLLAMQQSWSAFLGVSGSLENMQTFQQDLEQAKERNGKIDLKRVNQSINSQDISFSFGDTKILKNINLEIPKNQSIAFVGESGSGKTTLVNVLAGLLEPSTGSLLIDEQELKTLNKKSYQKRIGYITQEAAIFNDTVYNNITFWAEKTADNWKRFEKAIAQAALKTFVEESPNGADTMLGNNGINLSGGQKQRISIARELFKDIDVLIMDEATSALDSETERTIQDSIDKLKGQYTLIIVAHRLATIRNVDKVVYMHQGKIEDHGTFEELVKKLPRFRKMVELQEL